MSENYNYAGNLFALAKAANARRIIEIGAGPEGGSGQVFASALPSGGELWSVEIDTNRPPLDVLSSVEKFDVAWHVLHGDSLTVPLDGLAPGFDLLYIDGDHGGDHALGDFRRFAPLVRAGGFVVYDDFPIATGVVGAVAQLAIEGIVGLQLPYNHQDGNSHYVFRLPQEWPA